MLRHKRQIVDADRKLQQLEASPIERRNKYQEYLSSSRTSDIQSNHKRHSNDHHHHLKQQQRLHDHDQDDDEEELQWRQAAQMLSDDDEIFSSPSRTTQPATSRTRTAMTNQPTRQQLGSTANNRTQASATGGNSARATPDSSAGQPEEDLHDEEYLDDDDDDNSSISFAQSGCHSILSAWRIKAANRAKQQQQLGKQSSSAARPTSVLSNASSAKKSIASTAFTFRSSGRAPASQSRIPLGPKQAQHFVTNTRRRRRANELILTTLEARRRALALNRQNASLFGSGSYLNADLLMNDVYPINEEMIKQHNSRLSLSPSPVNQFVKQRTPSPSLIVKRSALSDLGGTRGLTQQMINPRRQQILDKQKQIQQQQRPPLAKLDQNSSDLNTANSSSSESSSSSSENSKFTQLVTSELAPDCIVLLDEQALRPPRTTTTLSTLQSDLRDFSAHMPKDKPKPKAPERQQIKRKQQAQLLSQQQKNNNSPITRSEDKKKKTNSNNLDSSDSTTTTTTATNKLRRGALRRDSIRRLRLDRKKQLETGVSVVEARKGYDSSSSDIAPSLSEDSSPINQKHKIIVPQALPTSRKLDIENNPFLNRGHFRSTSVRSQSRSSQEIQLDQEQKAPERKLLLLRQLERRSNNDNNESKQQQRRNSWLFGKSRQQDKLASETHEDIVKEARVSRSNSSDHLQYKKQQHQRINNVPVNIVPPASSNNNINGERNKLNKQLNEHEREEASSSFIKKNNHADNVKQVERMLRQMKPNQVFTSYNNSKETIGQEQKQQNIIRNYEQTTATNNDNINDESPLPSKTTTSFIRSGQQTFAKPLTRSQQQSSNNNNNNDNSFVREGSKSHSDHKFDLLGNKNQIDSEKKWRYEYSTSSNVDNPQIIKSINPQAATRTTTTRTSTSKCEERLIKSEMEIIRSTSISPPLAFSGKSSNVSSSAPPPTPVKPPKTRLVIEHRTRPIEAPQRKSHQYYQQEQFSREFNRSRSSPPNARVLADDNDHHYRDEPSIKIGNDSNRMNRSISAERQRPPVAERRRAPIVDRQQTTVNLQQLPTFERTADDEFRKRVDYLRKLAKANLADSNDNNNESVNNKQQQRSTSLLSASTNKTTKPMTTNWNNNKLEQIDNQVKPLTSAKPKIQPRSSQAKVTTVSSRSSPLTSATNSGIFDERANWKLGRLSERPLSEARRSPATTNLDAILNDRYQSREELSRDTLGAPSSFRWHRSNSSLASLNYARQQDNSNLVAQGNKSSNNKSSSVLTTSKTFPTRPLSPLLLSTLNRNNNNNHEREQQLQQRFLMSNNNNNKGTEKNYHDDALDKPKENREFISNSNNQDKGVMKLVIKEKSAPKLNYAFVEQQPTVQHVYKRVLQQQQATNNNTTSLVRPVTNTTPSAGHSSTSGSLKQTTNTTTTNRTRSPVGVTSSPRSPDYGAMATSSNDDSAIASSVSSPSLSFLLNNNNNNNANISDQLLSKTTARDSAVQTQALNVSLNQRPQLLGLRQPKLVADSGASGTLQSILRKAHQLQHSGESSSDSSSQANITTTTAKTTSSTNEECYNKSYDEQRSLSPNKTIHTQQQTVIQTTLPASSQKESKREDDEPPVSASAPSSSPPKRVHFNDRTSIRSFESISSLASNTTAVPNEMSMFRQQVGSPDSMESGSGHSSRMSAESPDLRKASSGAAIYAVRGDPDQLDFDNSSASLINAIGLHTTAQLTRNPYGAMQQQQQQLIGQQQQQQPIRYGGERQAQQILVAPTIMQRRTGPQIQHQQQISTPFIRMTAPPTITTTTTTTNINQGAPHHQINRQQQTSIHGYIVRPTSLTSTHIMPAAASSSQQAQISGMPIAGGVNQHNQFQQHPIEQQQQQRQQLEDDEDPSYALRLRQAATSRVFQYAPNIQQHQQQVMMTTNTNQQIMSPQLQHNQMIIQQQRQFLPSQQQQHTGEVNSAQAAGQLRRSANLDDYVNFQTEV